jgi:23S rRNA (adenine2030-N6)-methyltransferase
VNYRHAFHAGNFADCMKHALLLWLLDALHRKPAGVFVLDTHAGIGAYDLGSPEALRTGEHRNGIARLLADPPAELQPYVSLVTEVGLYPGSPALIRARVRPQDRLMCCELHPTDAAVLRARFGRDPLVAVHERDAWEALGALLPPAQLKRALVLIDPPYEAADEFAQVARGIVRGLARCRFAVFAAWYPVKHRAPVRAFHRALCETGMRDVVAVELWLRAPLDASRLNGCGLLVVNPPFGFEDAARRILAALLDRLGDGEDGQGWAVDRLVDE